MFLELHVHQAYFLDNALLTPREYTHTVHRGEELCSIFLVAFSLLNRTLKMKTAVFVLFSRWNFHYL